MKHLDKTAEGGRVEVARHRDFDTGPKLKHESCWLESDINDAHLVKCRGLFLGGLRFQPPPPDVEVLRLEMASSPEGCDTFARMFGLGK